MSYEMAFEASSPFPAQAPVVAPVARLRLFALALMAYILFSQIGPNPFTEDTATALVRNTGDVTKQVVLLALCAMLLAASWDTRNLRANLALPASLLILLGYCLLSVAWAIDPGLSIRRLAFTALTMWFLTRSVALLGYVYTLESLRIALVILLLLNYATVLLSSHGIHHSGLDVDASVLGSWRGILDHKNIAGPVCALTILLFLFDSRTLDRTLRLTVIVLAGVFLWFTQSKTSMSALAVAVVAGAILPRLAALGRSFRVVVLVLLGVGAIQVSSIFAGDFITALDDPGAFTGRTQIWSILVEYARTHLWTGAGFDSFWQIGNAGPIWDYTNGWVAEVTGAGHNGYLDLLVTIGLPGLVLALVTLFLFPAVRVWMSDSIAQPERGLILALMTFVLVHNLGESQLFDRAAFDQEILIISLAFIGIDSQSQSLLKLLKDRIALARKAAPD